MGFRSDPGSIAIMKQKNSPGPEINLLMNRSLMLAKVQKIWAGFPPGLGGMGHIIMINLPCPPLLLSSSLGMLGECRYLMTVQTLRRLPVAIQVLSENLSAIPQMAVTQTLLCSHVQKSY